MSMTSRNRNHFFPTTRLDSILSHLNASNDRGEQQRFGLDATDHARLLGVTTMTGWWYTYHPGWLIYLVNNG
jgi:hypothetical protein